MITVHSARKQLGTISLTGGKLVASSGPLQSIADSATRKHGSAAKAYASLANTSNGYVTFAEAPSGAVEKGAAWLHELRGFHGRWEASGFDLGTPEDQARRAAAAARALGTADDIARRAREADAAVARFTADRRRKTTDAMLDAADNLPVSSDSLAAAMTMVDPKGLTTQEHELIAREFGANLDRVPPEMREALANRYTVSVVDAPGGHKEALGATGNNGTDWFVQLSSRLFNDTDATNKNLRDNAAVGYSVELQDHTADEALRYTVTHEFGHMLFQETVLARSPRGSRGYFDQDVYLGEQHEAVDKVWNGLVGHPPLIPDGYNDEAVGNDVRLVTSRMTRYGASGEDEMMAESYSAWALHGQGPDHSDRLEEAGRLYRLAMLSDFSQTREGAGMVVKTQNVFPGHCSGLPGSPDDFRARFGDVKPWWERTDD